MTTRLLVFDDDEAIGRLVARVARLAGLDVAAVTTPDAFIRSLRAEPPHVVMLDLQLGRTDGVEQLRVLADQHYTGSLILMSGYDTRVLATTRTLAENLGLNVATTLSKPIEVTELEAVFGHLRMTTQPLNVERLLAGIADDELILEFQPVVKRWPRVLKKLEALVRWDHPTLGRIPPDGFITMAEASTQAIDALTDWVFGATLDAYLLLAELGVPMPMSVNISTQNLHDLTLPDRLARQLHAAAIPPEHLCLEITETAAFRDAARTMEILSRVRLKGMQLAIDDFGTGYSSLKVLRQMPFSEIKIDKSFVADLSVSRDARAIVKSIVDLAANMDMASVAEGVESDAAATLLEAMNVGTLQGYFIARPMPIEAVPGWLRHWTSGSTAVPNAAGKSGRLSPRQLEVMQLLTDGYAVKEIAQRLNLGIGTVKVDLSLAYAALGARNRADAVLLAGLTPSVSASAGRIARGVAAC